MGNRAITTARQLGATIHDARTRAGLTQASLAASAGVSRKWLIGLEQGARTGAELGKVLAVLRTLDLSIQLIEHREQKKSGSQQADATAEISSDAIAQNTVPSSKPKNSTTSGARKALDLVRQRSALSRSTLDAMRQATQLPGNALTGVRQKQDEAE